MAKNENRYQHFEISEKPNQPIIAIQGWSGNEADPWVDIPLENGEVYAGKLGALRVSETIKASRLMVTYYDHHSQREDVFDHTT